mmetsp:Transcript_57437/g.121885  ORF Transcript_57437/g.121885 Transcript_57437/m.121885 type:complete len:347 (+) Transcript_57437:2298-3338(+)
MSADEGTHSQHINQHVFCHVCQLQREEVPHDEQNPPGDRRIGRQDGQARIVHPIKKESGDRHGGHEVQGNFVQEKVPEPLLHEGHVERDRQHLHLLAKLHPPQEEFVESAAGGGRIKSPHAAQFFSMDDGRPYLLLHHGRAFVGPAGLLLRRLFRLLRVNRRDVGMGFRHQGEEVGVQLREVADVLLFLLLRYLAQVLEILGGPEPVLHAGQAGQHSLVPRERARRPVAPAVPAAREAAGTAPRVRFVAGGHAAVTAVARAAFPSAPVRAFRGFVVAPSPRFHHVGQIRQLSVGIELGTCEFFRVVPVLVRFGRHQFDLEGGASRSFPWSVAQTAEARCPGRLRRF